MLIGYKRGISVFMMLLLVFASFPLIQVKEVSAQQPFCCVKTDDDQYCIESEDRSVLEGKCDDLRIGSCDATQISECRLGTCVPASGVCLSDYPEQKCTDEGGVWYDQEEQNVAECQIGCCQETSTCGLVQKTQCPGEFDSGITDARTCDASCATNEVGCCWSSGSCEFVSREDCSLDYNFELNTVCSAVTHCASLYEDHAYTACGDNNLIPNADLDVYWYDSNGNMMEKVGEEDFNGAVHYVDANNDGSEDNGECDYPDYKCYDPDDKGGRDNAYCRSTACVLDCEECEPQNFLHGESICLTIGKGKFTNEDRSKYLREYILACDSGEVVEDRELDRTDEVCIDDVQIIDDVERKHASTVRNNWAACSGGAGNEDYCGEGGGVWDYGGYIPIVGGPLLAFGSWCTNGMKMPGAYFGGDDSCESAGKIGDVEMCYYDHDLWSPIGSCNPVYTPATSDRCGECGNGGDGATNMCTEEECNALGDCVFEHKNLDPEALLATGALALGTATSTMVLAEGVCAAAGFIGGPPAVKACKAGFLEGIGNILGSKLYWGLFGAVYGIGGAASQGYHSDGVTDVSFKNDDGTYDLAQVVVSARAIQNSYGGFNGLATGEIVNDLVRFGGYVGLGGVGEWALENIGRKVLERQFKGNLKKLIVGSTKEQLLDAGINGQVSDELLGLGITDDVGNLNLGLSNSFVDALPESGQVTEEYADTMLNKYYDSVENKVSGDAAINSGNKFATFMKWAGIVYTFYTVSESFNVGDCRAETAYTDNSHCEQCGPGEGQFFCTEDRCNILGGNNGNCKFVPKEDGTDDGFCISVDPTVVNPPVLGSINLQVYDEDDQFVIQRSSNGKTLNVDQELKWTDANNIKINITTDIRSDCKADFNSGTDFEDMEYTFDSPFDRDHELSFNLTSDVKTPGEATLYIKCMNVNGIKNNENEDINWIRLRFGDRPDILPPEIVSIDPYKGIFFPEGTDSVDLSLIVYDNNGVKGCKYSTDENTTNYVDMEVPFDSAGTVRCPNILEENCNKFTSTFDLSSGGEEFDLESMGYEENGTIFSYSFGCIDNYNPANEVTLNYSIIIFSSFEMNMSSPDDGEQVYDNTPYINISTNVDTQCSYRLNDQLNWTEINDGVDRRNYNYEIEDPLDATVPGVRYDLTVRCRDLAYNYRELERTFYVLADAEGPYPVRIYTKGSLGASGTLYVQLNEDAECKFSTEEKDFDYDDEEEATLMRAVLPRKVDDMLLSETHSTTWDSDVYYVTCKDEWENEASFTIYP